MSIVDALPSRQDICAAYGHNWHPWRSMPIVREIGEKQAKRWRERMCATCCFVETEDLPVSRGG